MSFVEAPNLRKLILKHNPPLIFLSKQTMVNEILVKMAKKTKEKYTFKILESCNSCIMNFDLWMCKAGMDIFILIVHFLMTNESFVI